MKVQRIAFTGPHDIEKTILVKILSNDLQLFAIQNIVSAFWEDSGIYNIEKLSPDIRIEFQKELILSQLKLEDKYFGKGFVTDMSLLDYLAYTKLLGSLKKSDWEILKALVKERLSLYTHIIYLPIESLIEQDKLRTRIAIQRDIDNFIKISLPNLCSDNKFIWVSGSIEEKLKMIKNFLEL